jgi:hypothetical protein
MNRRSLWIALLVVAGLGAAAPFLSADYFRGRIERALESALGREVELGAARFNLFTGPGFTVRDVLLYDDPSTGIEPFARVATLEARINLLSIFSGQLEFSSLRLVEPSVNFVKPPAGPWNFQLLLERTGRAAKLPSILVRSGRLNFKFGDRKSVLYFRDTDLDLEPGAAGAVRVRFAGLPARTDRAAQYFGALTGSGTWKPGDNRIDLAVELERSHVAELFRLASTREFPLGGAITARVNLKGPADRLAVDGEISAAGASRWTLLFPASRPQLAFGGVLDLYAQRLELRTRPSGLPLTVEFRAANYLAAPEWRLAAKFDGVDGPAVLELARRAGVALAAGLSLTGALAGEIELRGPDGDLAGAAVFTNVELGLPDALPVRFPAAHLALRGGEIRLEPAVAELEGDGRAQVEAVWRPLHATAELKLSTRRMKVEQLTSAWGNLFGGSQVPLLSACRTGDWSGTALYRRAADGKESWAGDLRLSAAEFPVAGLSAPVVIDSARVTLNGDRIALREIAGRAGEIGFQGRYRLDPAQARPVFVEVQLGAAEEAQLEKLLAPSLVRERGFLARTLRLEGAAVPEWLRNRRIDGTLAIAALTLAGETFTNLTAAFAWTGPRLSLTNVEARLRSATVAGTLAADLTAPEPRYTLSGRLLEVDYLGGSLDLEGKLETRGTGAKVLAEARAEGTFKGRRLTFPAEGEFRAATGAFQWSLAGGSPKWKLTDIEAVAGGETFTGSGATQPDGRLVIEIAGPRRQLRLVGAGPAL